MDYSNFLNSTDNDWAAKVEFIGKGFLEPLNFQEERPYQPSDFSPQIDKRQDVLNEIQKLVGFLKGSDSRELHNSRAFLKHVMVPIVVLCTENALLTDWTKVSHVQVQTFILNDVRNLYSCSNNGQLLIGEGTGLQSGQFLRWCLELLHPKLEKDTWKKYPGAQFSFRWILEQIKHPFLGEHIQEFLPFCLRFIDDWEVKNQVFGVKCLHHLIKEVSPSHLTWFGRSDLLYEALFHLLYRQDIEVIQVTYPCLFELQMKSDVKPNETRDVNKVDKIAEKLFSSLEMESKLDLRRCYGKQLMPLLQILNVGVVRWLSKLVRILNFQLEYPDNQNEEFRIDLLKSLLFVFDVAPERIANHTRDILESLIRLLFQQTKLSFTTPLSEISENALMRLSSLAPAEVSTLCKGLRDHKVNERFDAIVDRVLQSANESQCIVAN